ncbi:hypothetical protein Geob_1126 [Geotalea daltonii FRC-32]|uniref:Uncharacterized protein n=1 Tax=Geotalea daltonii (strain DSM 22248 / JCM 15807 / FRC-32) TaxID=316067 RepID=B9M376_GEODF|nr:hypothetical protein [Geotalea daltonii]ACM19486.1 hypothetical protein Geob_1126 [Geotalea daltonii FRC-32]
MVQIIDKKINLEFPQGHHLHCLIAQIPNHLRRVEHGFALTDPEEKWTQVKAILDLISIGEGNLKKLHFLVLPETSIPFSRFDEMLAILEHSFRPNTVTMFGVEHIRLRVYRELLERFRENNDEAIELVDRDIDSGDILDMPVNWCCIAVKEATGKLRVFLEAKSHPFHGEEFLDKYHDLYRGRHFYLFRSRPSCFNFMALICLDYIYRDLYASNIKQIIDHADRLFFSTKQGLDALFVIQCNPKPEHRAYFEVISGFYGEFLEDTPGVRETVSVFANTSDETSLEGLPSQAPYGNSFVVMNKHYKLGKIQHPEFTTDNFSGAPVCRLRFGSGTRLYYINLPLYHELDPRTSRIPLKVHVVLRWSEGKWVKIQGDEMVAAVTG